MEKIIILGLLVLLIACEVDSISPSEEILGKWKIVEIGYESQIYQVDYDWYYEFLPNHIVKQYSDSSGLMFTYEYQIDDTLIIGSTKYT